MIDIFCRGFVVVFVLLYSGLFLSLVGWSVLQVLRRWPKGSRMARTIDYYWCMASSDHSRDD